MIEVWKTIDGFEGRYDVSNLGRVRAMFDSRQWKSGRLLTLQLDRKGYQVVGLQTQHFTKKMAKVHRLVMAAFHGNDDRTVNHKDGNKANNNLENLEYLTLKENIRHAHASGLITKTFGEKHWNAKLSDAQVEEMAEMERQNTRHWVIAERFGLRKETVSSILRLRYARTRAFA